MASPDGVDAMKTIFKKSVSLIMLFVMTTVISCTPSATEQMNIVASETSTTTPTETLIVTPTLENTFRTPVPTLSINVEQKMVETLKSSKCSLPCYMGITPGKTTWDEAKVLLESLGAKFQIQNTQDSRKGIDYLILIDDPSISMVDGLVEDHRISHDIAFIAFNGIVQKIRIWILGRGISPKFQEYWSRYTPKGVFLQIGVPDEIYSTNSGALALVYKQLGIINIYETFWEDGQLCPQNETVYFDRRFEITNPDSPFEIYSENEASLKVKEIWNPIEESLDVSVQEFYDQVITDDSICFDIKIK